MRHSRATGPVACSTHNTWMACVFLLQATGRPRCNTCCLCTCSEQETRARNKRGRAAELALWSLLVHARCMLRCRMAEWKHESMRKNQAYGPPGSLSSRRSVSTPCLNASCPLRAAATCTKSRGVDTRSTCRGRNGHRHLADQHTHTRAGRGAEDWRTRTLTAAHTATARRPAATTARREDVACRVDRWST